MKKFYALACVLGVVLAVTALPALATVEREAGWTLIASSPIVFTCGGGSYPHTLDTVLQEANGDFTGTGFYNPNHSYTWYINGNITGDTLTFELVYTGTNYGYTLNGTGTIDPDGTIHGTTDGNCQEFDMDEESANQFFAGNHGQYVRYQENKRAAAHSRIGMPVQSKGHSKTK